MTKKAQGIHLSACGVAGCKDPRVIGTAYCQHHATIESRTASDLPLTRWIMGGLLGLGAIWCLANAFAISGLTCSRVSFDWSHLFTGAFACVPELVDPAASASFLTPQAGTTTSVILAGSAIALFAISAIVLYGSRRDR